MFRITPPILKPIVIHFGIVVHYIVTHVFRLRYSLQNGTGVRFYRQPGSLSWIVATLHT